MSEDLELEFIDLSSSYLEQIIALHRANSRTLGFFPRGAFEEHARNRHIIAAIDHAGSCVGYILYRISRGRASIVHLCTSESARRKGAARLLVDRLKEETKSLEGIGLYCRRDYNANHLWPKFGFEAVHRKPGRGSVAQELTFWWFSHGHTDLFTRVYEPSPIRQRVVIDANVFFDLHGRSNSGNEDSKALLADWVQGSIELVVTKELSNEIDQAPNKQVREASRAAASHYVKLLDNDADFQRLCSNLRHLFPASITLRDEADLRQVAHAIAGGASYLVTRDQELIDRGASLYRSHGLSVLHPAELINHLDAIEREADYRPGAIEGSRLKCHLLKADVIDSVVESFKAPGERIGSLKASLHHCLSLPHTIRTELTTDQANCHIVLGAIEHGTKETFSLPILRMSRHALAGTLMRNFLRAILTAAASSASHIVDICDPYLQDDIKGILREFGFVPRDGRWSKLTLQAVGPIDEIKYIVCHAEINPSFLDVKYAASADLNVAAASPDSATISAIERQLWPTKVVSPEIPTFIVPIRPEWAQHFFDAELSSQLIFGLREDLHLGVEGVYYRKAGNNNLQSPGRILWYVSSSGGSGSMTIKACSQLEEVISGKPKDLFRRFQRLGIYQWEDVYATAERDITKQIAAFRFRMTERFKHPVSMAFLKELGIRGPFMSPRRITPSQFAAIYKKGFAL